MAYINVILGPGVFGRPMVRLRVAHLVLATRTIRKTDEFRAQNNARIQLYNATAIPVLKSKHVESPASASVSKRIRADSLRLFHIGGNAAITVMTTSDYPSKKKQRIIAAERREPLQPSSRKVGPPVRTHFPIGANGHFYILTAPQTLDYNKKGKCE